VSHVRVTERDHELLAFAAEHRLVLPQHVQAMLALSSARAASARLHALSSEGLLTKDAVFRGHPPCFRIARKGLAIVGCELPPPRLDLRNYQHDVGVAWLWLAARGGAFGQLSELLSERRLRSHDSSREGRADPFGVRLGGVGPGGRERLHYPDLLLTSSDGRRVAVELELSSKGRARREGILAGYGADHRIDAVLYLAHKPQVARAIRASAAALGLGALVHVQRVRWPTEEKAARASMAAERAQTGHVRAEREVVR
jgi:hypothetical protein